MQNFQGFFPLKETLVDTLGETCTLTSRSDIAEKDMNIPNLSETLRLFRLHSFVFDLEKSLKSSKF